MISTGFFSIGRQVAILFILISTGYICSKSKLINAQTIPGINNMHIYVVMPSVIIESFHRDYSPDMLASLGIVTLAALAVHAINIAVITFFMREKRLEREAVLRFAGIFSNCGNMGIPLQIALLGTDGVFYSAAFIAVSNTITWTYGIFLMNKREASFSPKKLLLNPGILGITIGFLFFLTPLSLPNFIFTSLRSITALNTPMSMVVIGYYLSCIASVRVIFDAKLWLVFFFKLLALPLAEIFLFYILGLRGPVLASLAISACAPVAANTLVFAAKFGKDTELAVTLVSISTLVSIATMPLVVSLSMLMAGGI